MSKAGMVRRCAIELRVWQYFRWLFLAYGAVCIVIGVISYRRACIGSTSLMTTLLPPGALSGKPPAIGKSAQVGPDEARRMELQANNVQLVYSINHMYEQVEERAELAIILGVGIVLVSVYRWSGSLAVRLALELGQEDNARAGDA